MAFWGESSGTGNEPAPKRIKTNDDNEDWLDVTIPDYIQPIQPGKLAPIPPRWWAWFARNDTPNMPGELTMHGPDTHPTITATTKPQSFEPQVRKSDDYLLKLYGFKIDWHHLVGSGVASMGVYVGIYGRNIRKYKDINGQYLRDVKPGDRFAAKYVLIKTPEDIDDYESEKQVIKHLDHPNIVRFRMAINLGDRQPVYSTDGTNQHLFDTYSRMILIMDYADQGALSEFQFRSVFNNREVCNTIITGICHGQKYLHDMCVVQQDLHPGNVLIFSVIANDGGISYMAKLSDFGRTTAQVKAIPGHRNTVNTNEFTAAVTNQLDHLADFIRELFDTIGQSFFPPLPTINDWTQVIEQLENATPLAQIFPD